MDFWNVGNSMFHVPLQNVYIPVRNTIMKKPNLFDEDHEHDEMGYMFNNYDDKTKTRERISPMEQLSPLRSNYMAGGIKRKTDNYYHKTALMDRKPTNYSVGRKKFEDVIDPKRFNRWRRLSAVRDRSFSTSTNAYSSPVATECKINSTLVTSSQSGVSLP